jgi:hypothetical protein
MVPLISTTAAPAGAGVAVQNAEPTSHPAPAVAAMTMRRYAQHFHRFGVMS